jgi:hypothetical protein
MTIKINYLGNHFPPEIIRRAISPQTRRETAECLRAKATFAFFMPARLARRRLQHFNAPPLTARVIVTLAAS